MTASRSVRRSAAWVVPAATIATITAAVVLPSTATASPHPSLPAQTAGQLLASVETTNVRQLTGTVVETARLGFPDLPGADNASALSPQTLATGTHTFRVWIDGADKQRLAMLGQLSESDVIHNGADLWTFDSNTQTVGHTTTSDSSDKAAAKPEKVVTKHTPQDLAAEALKAIDPSTQVTVDRTARVAGRAAYTLVLTPRDTRSTVREVAIAIDAKRMVPLRVQVFGKAARPAFEIAFTDVSFSKPAASVFRFTAPRGAKITKDLFGATDSAAPDGTDTSDSKPAKTGSSPKVLGSGWTTVLALPSGGSPLASLTGGSTRAKDQTASVLDKLTTTLPNGDKVLLTALVNILTTPDGRTFVGAVSVDVLELAAAGKLG
jgi:outer membrane lipoprotein-sorting protein